MFELNELSIWSELFYDDLHTFDDRVISSPKGKLRNRLRLAVHVKDNRRKPIFRNAHCFCRKVTNPSIQIVFLFGIMG